MKITKIFSSNSKKGLLLGLGANIIWGTTFLASSKGLQFFEPFTIVFLRFLLAALAIWIFCIITGKELGLKFNRSWKMFLLNGLLCFVLLYAFQITALKYIPSGLSASIMLLSPLLVVLASCLFSLTIRFSSLLGVSLGAIGGFMLIYDRGGNFSLTGTNELSGMILTFLSAISLSLSTYTTKNLTENFGVLKTTFWSIIFSLPILAILSIFEIKNAPPVITLESLGYLFYLSIICSVLAFFMWNKAIALFTPEKFAGTMHIKTLVAILLGFMIANETLTTNFFIGTAVIMLGITLSRSDKFLDLLRIKFSDKWYRPDVIIEATNFCNKRCAGCYAPNALVDGGACKKLSPKIAAELIKGVQAKVKKRLDLVFIGGGEPTANEELSAIISEIKPYINQVVIETNGQWLLDKNFNQSLMDSIKGTGSIVKIGFDEMHGTPIEQLKIMLEKLDEEKIQYKIGITGNNTSDIKSIMEKLSFLSPSDFIFHKKVVETSKLTKARYGVINVRGELVLSVNSLLENQKQKEHKNSNKHSGVLFTVESK
ncbi:MAG: EamA family transporter [Oligoflexia bacterium]|nr:EamA family transporter [Oligoflexia bacterium]